MTEARLASGIIVSALIRQTSATGGHAMVIAKGDDIAGAILLLLIDRGVPTALIERVWRFDDGYGLEPVGPGVDGGMAQIDDYIARRRKSDPDLWVIEIDHRDARGIADLML